MAMDPSEREAARRLGRFIITFVLVKATLYLLIRKITKALNNASE